ncbi:MAG: hypothetical protein HY840_05715 [Bacteroidetes bacterium]|nr:hypothetical protein [Bacteroidota bacterium]
MKKITLITIVAIASVFLLPSCALLISGAQKNIFMVDAPKDLVVTKGNEVLEIKNQTVGSSESGNTRTHYEYPGVRLKMKGKINLQLKSGEHTASVPIKKKLGGIPILILEAFFTFGVGTIIDLVTNAAMVPSQRFIDVPATLNKKTPRSQKELHKLVLRGG